MISFFPLTARVTLARERELRRSEHKALLATMQKHGIFSGSRASSSEALDNRKSDSSGRLGGDEIQQELVGAGAKAGDTPLPLDQEAWRSTIDALEIALQQQHQHQQYSERERRKRRDRPEENLGQDVLDSTAEVRQCF